VRVRTVVAAAVACVGLTALAAWVFAWSFEKAASLSPIIVVAAGAIAGLLVLWTRIAWESIKETKHPRRVVLIGVSAVALIVVLTILGVNLPRE
jgi:hypothetical protein